MTPRQRRATLQPARTICPATDPCDCFDRPAAIKLICGSDGTAIKSNWRSALAAILPPGGEQPTISRSCIMGTAKGYRAEQIASRIHQYQPIGEVNQRRIITIARSVSGLEGSSPAPGAWSQTHLAGRCPLLALATAPASMSPNPPKSQGLAGLWKVRCYILNCVLEVKHIFLPGRPAVYF
jgi:hypothetical protein